MKILFKLDKYLIFGRFLKICYYANYYTLTQFYSENNFSNFKILHFFAFPFLIVFYINSVFISDFANHSSSK